MNMSVKARKKKNKEREEQKYYLYQELGYLYWVKWVGLKNPNPHPTHDIHLLGVLTHYHL